MCGLPRRLNSTRSIALASVAVPTVEREFGAHALLVDDDRRRQPFEHVDLGPGQRRHEALHERAVGLVDQPLRLGGDGAEDERRLARPRDAGEHRQPPLGDLDADVLQIVLARALDDDEVVAVGGVLAGRGHTNQAMARAARKSPTPKMVWVIQRPSRAKFSEGTPNRRSSAAQTSMTNVAPAPISVLRTRNSTASFTGPARGGMPACRRFPDNPSWIAQYLLSDPAIELAIREFGSAADGLIAVFGAEVVVLEQPAPLPLGRGTRLGLRIAQEP